MSSEPPSKKSRIEPTTSSSLVQPKLEQADNLQPDTPATNPYQGNCRAYGGSEHLPFDLESQGFQLLDEANADDDNDGPYTDTDNDSSVSSERVSQEEIHALLEEGVAAALDSSKQPQNKQQAEAKDGDPSSAHPRVIQKFLVADLDNLFNHFERLPEGWAQITHNSGLPVYLHRPTRVCTFGRPYFMGDGSVRKHDVPLSAIPCLHYRRVKGDLEGQQETPLSATGGCPATAGDPATGGDPATAGDPASTEDMGPEQPPTDVTSLVADDAPAETAETALSETINLTVAPSSCPFYGATGAASISECVSGASRNGSVVQDSTGCGSKETVVGQVENERNSITTPATDVPSNDKSNSSVALTRNDDAENSSVSVELETATKSLNPVTNGTSDNTAENVTNDTSVLDSQLSSIVKKEPVSPPKQSSTFNTALAAALNICPSQPPPKGAPPGSEEVQLEPLKLQTIDADNLRHYCSSRFRFQTVQKMRFNTWSERRNYTKEQRRKNRPPMPEGTKLLSLKTRTYSVDDPRSHKKRNWVLNPKGKSYVCILHEYLQHVLKGQPAYVFKEVQNASSPYAAAIFVNGFEYATGYGSSKRQAKCEAARSTLEILMPELVREIEENEGKKNKESDLEFFDSLRIEDPNVNELCSKMSELPPYSLLLNCIQRNYCLKSDSVQCRLITNNNQRNEFVMTVGKHTVQVPCKNKKEGKQKASQALLQKLHPQINSWGSMVRLYGNRSLEVLKDKKKVEQEVTLLQNNATVNQPNYSILNLLKAEMLKLHKNKQSVRPMGEFCPPEDIRLPTPSSSDLNTLDL